MKDVSETGKTKSAGYQVGTRRTFPLSAKRAWDFLLSKRGLGLWLGDLEPDTFGANDDIQLPNGGLVRLTTFRPESHLRLKWQPAGWTNNSTLQLRVISKEKDKTTIAFHQEHLLDAKQRAEMKRHWQEVLDSLEEVFK
jgi:uncharacterized protein YndB with AHSA1/START domain